MQLILLLSCTDLSKYLHVSLIDTKSFTVTITGTNTADIHHVTFNISSNLRTCPIPNMHTHVFEFFGLHTL